MPTVGVILSGCGVYDGSEIHEAVLTLLALDKVGVKAKCLAPDILQMHVVDHLKGEPSNGDKRAVLIESARIARGDVFALEGCSVSDIQAVILPGGFGAAKNLSDYAVSGENISVEPTVKEFLVRCQQVGKPLGFACISPIIAAKLFGDKNPKLTIGNDVETAAHIQILGGKHIECIPTECVIDKDLKIVSTPAYMNAKSIKEVAEGIEKMVNEVLALR